MQSKQILVVILLILGLYFLVDHVAPLPLNHEAIGLGTNHMAHRIFGLVLLLAAGYIWWKGKKKKSE